MPRKTAPFRGFLGVFAVGVTLCLAPAAPVAAAAGGAAPEKLLRLMQAQNDPLSKKLLRWLYATEGDLPIHAPDLMLFALDNPHWPRMGSIRAKIEENIAGTVGAEDAALWFGKHPPQTYAGIKAYMQALIARRETTRAHDAMADFWRRASLNKNQTASLVGLYGAYLTPQLHAERLDNLIWQGRYGEADAMLAFAGPVARQTGQVRLALARMSPNVNGLLDALPAHLQNHEGIAFERMRWRRKKNMDSGALDMLAHQPAGTQRADIWWKEINILARRAIEKGDYARAHGIIRRHRMTEGSDYAQAEWLLGWLALRFLHQPAQAYPHFEKMYGNVRAAVSKSRAAYWAARAAEAMPDTVLSQQWHQRSAGFASTYYGQLSRRALKLPATGDLFRDTAVTQTQQQAFDQKELVRVARLLHRLDMSQFIDPFLARLLADAAEPAEFVMIARLAKAVDRPYYVVQANKDIQQKHGVAMPDAGYPVISPLPSQQPERALVHAIIYRESMFNPQAASSAGALGLMQLMPGTAREVSKKLGLGYSREKLTRDRRYNITLGSRYLQNMLDRYNGFYPMAIAAYNAGPRRVDEWIVQFGDPRTGKIDLIDWIELIPIYETRNYIQRVMETYYMYRVRFDETPVTVLDKK